MPLFSKKNGEGQEGGGVTVMMPSGGDVRKAQAEILRLETARAALDRHAGEVRAELAQLTASLGAADLESFLETGGAAGEQRVRIHDLALEESGAAGALAALFPRLLGAHKALYAAQGADLRRRASDLQEKLDKHLRRRDELLQPLQDHEQCKFVSEAEKDAEVALLMRSVPGLAASRPMRISPTVSQRLGSEINALLRKAATLEARVPPSKGSVAGVTLAELLAGADDPEAIAPSRAAVEAWFHQASAAAERSWYLANGGDGNRGIPPRECAFQIVWTMGQIDWQKSGFTNMPAQPDQDTIREQARQKQQARAAGAQVAPAPLTPAELQDRADAAGRKAWPVPAGLGVGAEQPAAIAVQDFEAE